MSDLVKDIGGILGFGETSGESAAKNAGDIQAKAYEKAGETQAQAYEKGSKLSYDAILKGIEEMRRQFDSSQGRYNESIQRLDPYNQGGQSAFKQQQALSGLLGPEAQKQAYAAFENSPGQDFLKKEAEKSLVRQAASIGGLGGASLKNALQKQAIGLAQQNYQNYFNNLSGLTGTGLNAATNQGGLTQNFNNLAQNYGQNMAQMTQAGGNALAAGEIGAASSRAAGMTGGAEARASGIIGGQEARSGALENMMKTGGLIAGIFSDIKLKHEINNLNLEECFNLVTNLPLKSWRYIKDVGVDEDIHFGPMAQDAPECIKIQGKEILSLHDELMMIAGAIQYMKNNNMLKESICH